MSYTARSKTLADVLNDASQGTFDRALAKVKLGRMLKPVKVTITGLAAAAAIDLTTAATRAAATLTQGLDDLGSYDTLPPILILKSCRVTAVGSAALGPRIPIDSGGTAIAPSTYAGHVKVSEDGTTLTFEGTVTGLVIEYVPRSAEDLGNDYPLS